MRCVPERHLEASLIVREPICHHSSAWRPSHSGKHTHHEHDTEEHRHIDRHVCSGERKESYGHHNQRCHNKTDCKELSCIRTVGKHTHSELAECICDGYRRSCNTYSLLVDKTLCNHVCRSKREVLADQIICGIAKERSHEDLESHGFINAVDLLFRKKRLRLRRIKEFCHNLRL